MKSRRLASLASIATVGLAALVAPSQSVSAAVVPATPATKVLVFVEENHSLAEMKAGMPYTFSQAMKFGYATDYHAVSHPSLPNYLAIASGKTYGITVDQPASKLHLTGRTVFRQALLNGRTTHTYAETMTSNCQLDGSGLYAARHNPWTYFSDTAERAACNSNDTPETPLSTDITNGTLPNVGLVVPNLCDDAHNCSLGTADDWFKTRLEQIFAGPDWQAGRLAVILTADEDDKSQNNTVLTVVIHPSQIGNVVSTPLTHYSLTRTLERFGHAQAFLNNAATATDLATSFGLPVS